MNQLENQRDWTEDFKIYDEFCENYIINNQKDLCQDRIYQNLVKMVEGNENIFYVMNNAEKEENEYEIVNVQRKPLNRKMRSLKSLRA